jgi:hypothetical protein
MYPRYVFISEVKKFGMKSDKKIAIVISLVLLFSAFGFNLYQLHTLRKQGAV